MLKALRLTPSEAHADETRASEGGGRLQQELSVQRSGCKQGAPLTLTVLFHFYYRAFLPTPPAS